MNCESWLKIWCPNCNKANWLCQGDMSDCTATDIEAFECFSCGTKHWLDEDMFHHESYLEGDEDEPPMTREQILDQISFCEKGREQPR